MMCPVLKYEAPGMMLEGDKCGTITAFRFAGRRNLTPSSCRCVAAALRSTVRVVWSSPVMISAGIC